MKKYIITLLLAAIICAPFSLSAQVTIGSDEAPRGFSVLELISNDERGLRLPRMTTPQRTALEDTPEFKAEAERAAMGLMIFNTTEGCLEVWNGSDWISLCMSKLPWLSVTRSWIFPAISGASRTFEVLTNLSGDISVTPPPAAWANSITINQAARTFTITTTAPGLATQRPFYTITVTVGGLSQEVRISQFATVGTPAATLDFVGAFWRHNQFGERLIRMTAPVAGEWTAVATEPWIQLCLEPSPQGFPSPLTPGIADTPRLPTVAPHQGTYVTGNATNANNRAINFRIGIRACALVEGHNAPASATAAPRYGRVIVTYNNNTRAHIIWIRQGEAADYVMRPPTHSSGGDLMTVGSFGITNEPRNAARRISPFNLTAQTLNQSVGTREQQTDPVWMANPDNNRSRFTQYPTQAGAFWQWGQTGITIRRAWSGSGAPIYQWSSDNISGFWGTPQNLHIEHEVCPPGYRRPTDGSIIAGISIGFIGADNTRLSEIRQSLFQNPPWGDNSATHNSVRGFYADGFFDRRELAGQATSTLTEASVGAAGWIFVNVSTDAHVFLPMAGGMGISGGASGIGSDGMYATATSVRHSAIDFTYISRLRLSTHPGILTSMERFWRHTGISIRCVKE